MSDWKFDLDDVGDDDPPEEGEDAGDADVTDEDAGGVAPAPDEDAGGSATSPDEGDDDTAGEAETADPEDLLDLRPPLEAGDPDPEHVAFVLLGVVAMILVFVRLWLLVG